jgi:solute carrier family 25 iron transporter 28/37
MFAGCIPAHAVYFSIYEFMKKSLGADGTGHAPVRAAICGAMAATTHDFFMTPMDTIKQRMQLGHYRNVMHCMQTIIKEEGIRALYLSYPLTLFMNIPYGCIMMSINESAKKWINPRNEYSIRASMASGIIAGAVAAFLTNPLDVIKTRLQTQNLLPYRSGSSNSNSNSSRYETKTNRIRPPAGSNGLTVGGPLGLGNSLTSSKFSPILTVSRSITTSREAFQNIFKEAGIRGLWRGVLPRVLVHAPSVAISWTVYEGIKHCMEGAT